MKIKGTFTSVWDGGTTIVTNAILDSDTGEVITEPVDALVDTLDDEYFTAEDEDFKISPKDFKICPNCHTHILKTVMMPGIGHTYNKVKVCSDPNCEN